MRKFMVLLTGLTLFIGGEAAPGSGEKEIQSNDTPQAAANSVAEEKTGQVVVYYLHMNRRCRTCGKLEAYSKEAVESGFAEQLKDSSIVFRVENFEKKGNEHFAGDYKLYSQSLILSRQEDGKETEWKNLNKIWKLVGNKEEFISYVQTEMAEFLNPKEDK